MGDSNYMYSIQCNVNDTTSICNCVVWPYKTSSTVMAFIMVDVDNSEDDGGSLTLDVIIVSCRQSFHLKV